MKRDDDHKLWDLLGQTAGPKISPFFARNVVREIRQSEALADRRSWFSLRRLIPAVSLVMAIMAFAIMRSPKFAPNLVGSRLGEPAMVEAQDDNFLADLDELVAADESSSDIESAFL